MRLKSKVSLITGAGSGIGRATALLFAREGACVVAADRNEQQLEETQNLIAASGGKCETIALDVCKEEQIANAIAKVIKTWGQLDILFNNAGISLLKPVTETTEAEWDKVFNVNLKGVFFGCKHAIPHMAKQGNGAIVNTASELAIVAQPLYGAYCATKAGVLALTRVLALEWAAKGIRINAICPGPVATPMLQAEFDLADDPIKEEKLAIESIPAGRLGMPEDIARVALFLASEDAQFMHGAAVVADGGKTIF